MDEHPKRPDCYKCVHRLTIPGNAHTRCNNHSAKVEGHPIGIKNFWFRWPLNFDPTWLVSCNGFSDDKKDKMPEKTLGPMTELTGLMPSKVFREKE